MRKTPTIPVIGKRRFRRYLAVNWWEGENVEVIPAGGMRSTRGCIAQVSVQHCLVMASSYRRADLSGVLMTMGGLLRRHRNPATRRHPNAHLLTQFQQPTLF